MTFFRGGWLIWLSIAVAVILSIMRAPFETPSWFESLRPEWLFLIIYYWKIRHTDRVNIYLAWLLGFAVDVLLNEPLGTNPLCLIILLFTCHQMAPNLVGRRHTKVLLLLVALLCGLTALKSLILAFTYDVPFNIALILGRTASSIVLWFPIYLVFDRLAPRYVRSR